MTTYKLTLDPITKQDGNMVFCSDGIWIPQDPDNTDYQAFLKYQAEGGKVYGADEEVPNGQATE
jgi:hypothetical protein